MTLTQQKQCFYVNPQYDGDMKSLSNNKDKNLTMKTGYIKINSNPKKQPDHSFQEKLIKYASPLSESHTNFLENKMYALKKRILLPAWLLEGILLALGTKEPWFDSLACSRIGSIVACPNEINVKTLIPFFFIWNEILLKLFNIDSNEASIKLKINKYITGTNKDIQEISKEIETIFTSALKLFEIKPSKKTKALSMSKKGSLNFIRHAQLENDVDGIWLTLNLTHNFKEVCYPRELKNENYINHVNIVSISPVVIQSMGTRASLKKILSYLFLEFSKHRYYMNNYNLNSFQIECKKIINFHKDFLSLAPSFYDHGILGWNNFAPNMKISDIREMHKGSNHKNEIVCSWQLSEQVKDAYEIENAISEKILQQLNSSTSAVNCKKEALDVDINIPLTSLSLFPEPPEDELKKVREVKKIIDQKEQKIKDKKSANRSIHREPSSKKLGSKIITQKLFDDGLVTKKRDFNNSSILSEKIYSENRFNKECKPTHQVQTQTVVPNKQHRPPLSAFHDLTDKEFIILVTNFYESLNPIQKKAFERDRKGMSSEQFRAYMASILQRKKFTQL